MLLASFSEIAGYGLYILLAIVVLLVMITVHEFGHYISGKILGFTIEEFSIGFGPKIFSKKKKNGEIFSVRLLPLGGFCAFKGEDKEADDEDCFNNKKPWKRIIVLASGALMNYLTAIIVIALMFGVYGHSAIMTYQTMDAEPSSIYSEYSFKDRDVIIKADGNNVYMLTDVMDAINSKAKGSLVEFTILRDGRIQNVMIMLREDANFNNIEDVSKLCNSLGVILETDTASGEIIGTGFRTTGIKLGFFETISRSFEYSFKLAGTIFTVFGQLINGSLGLSAIGGTVTTISVTATAIKTGGLWSLLNITGLIGVNLAVFNLLPIPALDGSRIVFAVIEWIRKKPTNRRIESIIHTVGLVLIFAFAIIIDLNQCL